MRRPKSAAAICLGAAIVVCTAAQQLRGAVVFFDNFDGGQVVAPGVTATYSGFLSLEPVEGYAGLGPPGNQFGGLFLRNDTGAPGVPAEITTLTFTGLPAHAAIDVQMLLASIDSWDGADGPTSPDFMNIRVDGVTVFHESFAQASGTIAYSPPPGGLLSSGTNLGFIGGEFGDDGAYDLYLEPGLLNIPHTASTLTIDFYANGAGWQGNQGNPELFDESWAIDNLQVTLIPVPEPSSWALVGVGVTLLASASWRRIGRGKYA